MARRSSCQNRVSIDSGVVRFMVDVCEVKRGAVEVLGENRARTTQFSCHAMLTAHPQSYLGN